LVKIFGQGFAGSWAGGWHCLETLHASGDRVVPLITTNWRCDIKVINLTQHPSTPEQEVEDLTGEDLAKLKSLLTFHSLPTRLQVVVRAEEIADLALKHRADDAMIGGAPYLMEPLCIALRRNGIVPLFAFSLRESVETPLPDGSVKKSQVFRHLGFVDGY
jgi:hypothetical protein